MLIATDWRRGTREEDEGRLLSMFADEPDAPFSIHRFVNHGSLYCGKHPGEWFGPSATSRCIEYEDSSQTPRPITDELAEPSAKSIQTRD
jgi:hypothetical protein